MMRRAASMALVASTFVVVSAAPALASKEKFVRSKVHVNVGTVGQVDRDQVLVSHGSLLPVAPLIGEVRDTQSCSAEMDVRIVSAANPAVVLDERVGARIAPGEPLEFTVAPVVGEGPLTVSYAVVVRNATNVDGIACVLRGAFFVRDADGRTKRFLPLKPEDFFVFDPPR